MDEHGVPKLRWYQFTIRTLLLLTVAVSIVCSWLAVRWQRQREQRIVKVTISYPGSDAPTADDIIAKPYVFSAFSLPFKYFVTVSSFGQAEIYIVAQGVDPEEFVKKVRSVPTDTLPPQATVKEVTLMPRGAGIPQIPVSSEAVDTFNLVVDRKKCLAKGVSLSAISSAMSAQANVAATKEEGTRLLEQIVTESNDGAHTKVRLSEIAEIKVEKRPKQVVWHFPAEPSDSAKKQR